MQVEYSLSTVVLRQKWWKHGQMVILRNGKEEIWRIFFVTVSYSGSHNANMANGHMVNIAHSEKWKEELSNCAQVDLFSTLFNQMRLTWCKHGHHCNALVTWSTLVSVRNGKEELPSCVQVEYSLLLCCALLHPPPCRNEKSVVRIADRFKTMVHGVLIVVRIAE